MCHINLISLIINISQITSPASHWKIPRHPDNSSVRVKFNFLSNNTEYITSSGEHFPIMEGLWVVVGGRTDKNETKDLVQKDVLYIVTSVTLTSI